MERIWKFRVENNDLVLEDFTLDKDYSMPRLILRTERAGYRYTITIWYQGDLCVEFEKVHLESPSQHQAWAVEASLLAEILDFVNSNQFDDLTFDKGRER